MSNVPSPPAAPGLEHGPKVGRLARCIQWITVLTITLIVAVSALTAFVAFNAYASEWGWSMGVQFAIAFPAVLLPVLIMIFVWRWLMRSPRVCVSLFALTLLTIAGGAAYWMIGGHLALQHEREQWRQIGGKDRLEDYTFRSVPDDQNAAISYHAFANAEIDTPTDANGEPKAFDDLTIDECRQLVEMYQPGIDIFIRASKLPYYVPTHEFQFDIQHRPANKAIPLLLAQGRVKLADDDVLGSVNCLRAIWRSGDQHLSSPRLLDTLNGIGAQSTAIDAALAWMDEHPEIAQHLGRLLAQVKATDYDAAVRRTLLVEANLELESLDSGNQYWTGRTARWGVWDRDKATVLWRLRKAIAMVEHDRPWTLDQDFDQQSPYMHTTMVNVVMPAIPAFIRTAYRADEQRKALVLAVKLREYKRTHGDYPATLKPVGGAFRSRIDGEPIEYVLRNDLVVLRGSSCRSSIASEIKYNRLPPNADPASNDAAAAIEREHAWVWKR